MYQYVHICLYRNVDRYMYIHVFEYDIYICIDCIYIYKRLHMFKNIYKYVYKYVWIRKQIYIFFICIYIYVWDSGTFCAW